MIGVFLKTGFAPRKFFEMAFGTLGAALLQALAQGMVAAAVLLDGFPAEGLARAIGGQMDDSQIDAQGASHWHRLRLWHVQRDRQKEHAVAIEQIGLPTD